MSPAGGPPKPQRFAERSRSRVGWDLDRAGYPPEKDLPLAVRKDTGIDRGVMAWLLGQFPVEPLPQMLVPLTVEELRQFRDELRERIRRVAMTAPE